MTPQEFFTLFDAELPLYDRSHKINNYYSFARKGALHPWRKAYFLQRLEYIHTNIVLAHPPQDALVWDVGCGFGTSALFLAMNGIRTIGSTLESYHTIIPERKKYWRQFGDADLFSYRVEDLFSTTYEKDAFDFILLQDTLHHIEPIGQALSMMHRTLKSQGKLVVVDENGRNYVLRALLYRMRGNNRIMSLYDENLKRTVIMGNENVRPLHIWEKIIEEGGFDISDVQYIKFLPPYLITERNILKMIALEQKIWKKSHFLREGFFWGLNFVGAKQQAR